MGKAPPLVVGTQRLVVNGEVVTDQSEKDEEVAGVELCG